MPAIDYDFTQTRSQIVERSLRLIGALALGETLSGEAMNQGVTALNSMVKSWQNDHTFLWTVQVVQCPLFQGNVQYLLNDPIMPAIITVDAMWIYDGAPGVVDQMPLEKLAYRDYQQMVDDKFYQSEPTHFAIDNQRSPSLYVYPEPQRDYSAEILAVTKAKDWDTAAGDGDFPVRWLDALTYSLAANLGDEYGIPIGERQNLGQKAMSLYKDAKRGDRDQSDEDFVRGAFP